MKSAAAHNLAGDAFSRRLDPSSLAPVAVAFSGGPDSFLALQRTLAATSRPVIALHVDHGLNPGSAEWAEMARSLANDLGAGFRLLHWEGERRATGIPAAARAARHRLLADAARAAGAKVIVTGHTGDDALENASLGQGALYEWSPSPVWPEGRGLMLLRPLLAERRAAIRARLDAQGLLARLVDDPANADPRHPRIAVRSNAGAAPILPIPADLSPVAFEDLPGGAIRIPFAALDFRFLACAMTCVGGGQRIARRDQAERLLAARQGALAGARMIEDGHSALIVRNAGETARGGLAPLRLQRGETGVFDGRFEITAKDAPVEVLPLAGRRASLTSAERALLASLPAPLRPGLPGVLANGRFSCPILSGAAEAEARPLVAARLYATCGAIAHEKGL